MEEQGEETLKMHTMLFFPTEKLHAWVRPELGNRRNSEPSDKLELSFRLDYTFSFELRMCLLMTESGQTA